MSDCASGQRGTLVPLLHVDDDPRARIALVRALHILRAPWQVTSLRTPHEALKHLDAVSECVMLTDWMMPGIDGVTLCKQIREHERQRGGYAYIILLTGKQAISHVVEALDAGADDFLAKPYDSRELTARIRAGMRIVELQRNLRELNGKLESLAMRDPLTGLLNRRRGNEILDRHLDLVRRGKQELSVVLLDLNRFKETNDSYGHDAGDRLLTAVAQAILSVCRHYDSVIRWGGDEFLVVCPHTGPGEAVAVATRIENAIAAGEVAVKPGVLCTPTASAGTATASAGTPVDLADLVAAADAAMYAAKAHARRYGSATRALRSMGG